MSIRKSTWPSTTVLLLLYSMHCTISSSADPILSPRESMNNQRKILGKHRRPSPMAGITSPELISFQLAMWNLWTLTVTIWLSIEAKIKSSMPCKLTVFIWAHISEWVGRSSTRTAYSVLSTAGSMKAKQAHVLVSFRLFRPRRQSIKFKISRIQQRSLQERWQTRLERRQSLEVITEKISSQGDERLYLCLDPRCRVILRTAHLPHDRCQ